MADLRFLPSKEGSKLRYIIVSGKFEYADKLDDFIQMVKSHHPTFVTFNSPGGNLFKAMELGRLIRRFNLDTLQLRNLDCASACALAFVGGVTRIADAGSIGVHKTSFNAKAGVSVKDAVSAVQGVTAETMAYLSEMGVDPRLMQLAMRYNADDARYLSKSEMQHFKVTNFEDANTRSRTSGTTNQERDETYPSLPGGSTKTRSTASLSLPSTTPEDLSPVQPRSGRIRHPKGVVFVKAAPDQASTDLLPLRNRDTVTIFGAENGWYRIRAGVAFGYVHSTWVLVDQYHQNKFDDRYIQIKSLPTLAETNEYIRSSPLDLAAFTTPNGWFAITLRNSMELGEAQQLAEKLKSDGKVPRDAFVTYGNAYIRQACCNSGRSSQE